MTSFRRLLTPVVRSVRGPLLPRREAGKCLSWRPAAAAALPSLFSPGAKFVLHGPSGPLHLYSHPLASATVLPCDTGRAGDPTIFHASFDFSVIPRKDGEVRDSARLRGLAEDDLSVPAEGSRFIILQLEQQFSQVFLFKERNLKKKSRLR